MGSGLIMFLMSGVGGIILLPRSKRGRILFIIRGAKMIRDNLALGTFSRRDIRLKLRISEERMLLKLLLAGSLRCS